MAPGVGTQNSELSPRIAKHLSERAPTDDGNHVYIHVNAHH